LQKSEPYYDYAYKVIVPPGKSYGGGYDDGYGKGGYGGASWDKAEFGQSEKRYGDKTTGRYFGENKTFDQEQYDSRFSLLQSKNPPALYPFLIIILYSVSYVLFSLSLSLSLSRSLSTINIDFLSTFSCYIFV
jgi:hypothetical protein